MLYSDSVLFIDNFTQLCRFLFNSGLSVIFKLTWMNEW